MIKSLKKYIYIMYKPNKMYLVKTEPKGAALAKFKFPVVFRIVSEDGGISYDVTYDENGKRTILIDTDTDTTYDEQIEDLRVNKLNKPTSIYNGKHIDVLVIDPDGNTAIKPLSEFGQSDGEPNIITAVKLNDILLDVVNKTVNINVPTKTSEITNDNYFVSKYDIKTLNDIELVGGGNINLTPGENITILRNENNIVFSSINTTYDTGFIESLRLGASVEGKLWSAKTIKDFVLSNIPSVPNVYDGRLTITTSNDLVGSGTFTSNQQFNSNVNIALSDSILDNISKGVSAYDKRVTGLTFSGSETKILTIIFGDETSIQASFENGELDTNSWRPIKIQGTSGSSVSSDVLNGTILSQPLTLKAGLNVNLTHNNNGIVVIDSLDTIYSAGNGLQLNSKIFSQDLIVENNEDTNVVVKINQTSNGIKVIEGTMPYLDAIELTITEKNINENIINITINATIYNKSVMVFLNGVKIPKTKLKTITNDTITINNDDLISPIEVGDFIEIEYLTT